MGWRVWVGMQSSEGWKPRRLRPKGTNYGAVSGGSSFFSVAVDDPAPHADPFCEHEGNKEVLWGHHRALFFFLFSFFSFF